jgi:hypothetical protein
MLNSNKKLTKNDVSKMYLEYCREKNINSVYEHDNLFRTFCIEQNFSIPFSLYQKINIDSLNKWCDECLKENKN